MSMKLQVTSDLHLDTYRKPEEVKKFFLQNEDQADVLIVAGDVCEMRSPLWLDFYRDASKQYEYVLGVLGNHEYYETAHAVVEESIKELPNNVRILRREAVTLEGNVFAGTTLWFNDKFPSYRKTIGDFYHIPSFEPWVYQQHELDRDFLRKQKAAVIITHHMPCYTSVSNRFVGSPLNHFFVSDCTEIIKQTQPKLWVHGHGHDECYYNLGTTVVACNPLGYPHERKTYKNVIYSLPS